MNGHCKDGERCLCGGDTPRVRATCDNWVAAPDSAAAPVEKRDLMDQWIADEEAELTYRQTTYDTAAMNFEQELTNLLCRIHRDGGHYIAEHGLRKAIDDADIKVANLNAAQNGAASLAGKYVYGIDGEQIPVEQHITGQGEGK